MLTHGGSVASCAAGLHLRADYGLHRAICQSYVSPSHNVTMADEKQKSKPEEEKNAPRPVRVPRKISEPPGNLRKREQWFRKRSGS